MLLYEASDLYKKAMSEQNREPRIRTTIENKEYSGTDVQSCSIEESILTGEDFKFGSSTASSFDLMLLNMDESLSAKSFEGKEVHIEIGFVLDKFSKPVEFTSMGFFIIEEASKEKGSIRLSGFDRMILFEKPYVTKLTYPATLKQILIEICMEAGVPLETTSFLNDDYVVQNRPDLESVSLRMALEYVSELACSFARINRKSKLELVTLVETALTIDMTNYYDMKLSEYEYGPIDYVAINNEGILEDIGEGENILEIKDNIFCFNPNEQLLKNIYNRVKNFRFKPFNSTWQGNVLTAPGDVINVSYKDGETYKSFIAKQKFTFDTGLKCVVETNAKTQTQIDYETKGTVTAELGKVKASIKNMGNEIRMEVEEVGKSLAGLAVQVGEVEIYAEQIDQSVAALNVKADNISFSVTDLSGRLGNAESTLSIQAGQISSKVEQRDYNGNTIASLINQTASAVSIDASKINLTGYVTISSLDSPGAVTINEGNIVGSSFTVGRGSGNPTLSMYAAYGSHRIYSQDAAGFRIQSNGTLSLQADNGTIYANSKLWAQSGFQVSGFAQVQSLEATSSVTAANFYKNNGQLLVDMLTMVNMGYITQAVLNSYATISAMNAALALKESQIVAWANNKFVAK